MNTSLMTYAGIGFLGSIGFLGGIGGAEIAGKISGKPPPYHLELVNLEYRGGEFHQHIVPVGRTIIQANWSAKIVRDGHILCDGRDTAPYEGRPVSFNPSDWTGDKCPKLQPGDVGVASWEYKTNEGFTASISGEALVMNP